jgi:cold shock CspA family protein
VVVLKDSYGFIKCCERPVDLFFHFSALVDATPESIAFGQDVEFTCLQDGRAGKPIATRVTLAPKGSAVFESVDEARLRGVCRERLPAQKGYGGRGEAEPHGTIELTPEAPPAGDGAAEPAAAAAAEAELLPFFRGDLTAKMQPQPGDSVEFCVATDRRTGARHATRITLRRKTGVVVLVKAGYGFVELSAEEGGSGRGSRLFFHATEVEGGVALKERDECDFFVCLNAKTGEPNARKLRRTREAPPAPPQPERPERPERDKAAVRNPGLLPRMRRHRADCTGSRAAQAPRTTRMAEGPDGTPGFGMGRGKLSMQYGSQSKLSVQAQPFVPSDAAAAGADAAERHADAEE